MFILTDGKNYVMENPLQVGQYLSITYPIKAKEFTYKQARSLLHNKRKSLSWVKSFYMLNKETGKIETEIPQFSNEGVFCGDKDFTFDETTIEVIGKEVNSIVGLTAWDYKQLNSFIAMLNQGLQYYDSAISDVRHARMDKRPPANVRTKIDGILNELVEKRRDIKQTITYVEVMINAIKEHWTIGKVREELSKAKYLPYKGRTKYYDMVENLLKKY